MMHKSMYVLTAAVCCGQLIAYPMTYSAESDPGAAMAAEAAALDDGGSNFLESDPAGDYEANIATRCLMAQLSIVQGLLEHLSSDLVAAVPEEVAEQLQELLQEARSLESMAIDIGAGEYEDFQMELAADTSVQELLDRLDDVTSQLERRAYYNCPELEEVVSEILNILADLQ